MTRTLRLLLILALPLPMGTLPAQTAQVAATNFDSVFKPVKWRSIGPFRGGRSVAATGVVGDDIVINGLSFGLSEPEPVLQAARSAAMAAARQKAEELAGAAGATVGQALTITEGGVGAPVLPKARMAMAAEAMPIEAGEQELSVTVTVTYRLTSRRK